MGSMNFNAYSFGPFVYMFSCCWLQLCQSASHSLIPSHHSTGIMSHYRRAGLGTMLVTSLLEHVARFPSTKVVYLHVLADNGPAIGECFALNCCS